MPDLQNLLDQIDRLDQEATPGEWIIDSIESGEHALFIDEDNPGYGHLGAASSTVASFLLAQNANYIANARESLPQLAKALQAVLKLHRPETRWSYEPSPEWGFSTKVELFEFFDLDNEPHDPADVTQWQLCIHCAEVEQGAAEDLGHLTALYPCGTVQAITDALGVDGA